MKQSFSLIVFIALLSFASCNNSNKNKPTNNKKNTASHAKWDYTGESGPEHWADLESGSDCSGQHQSPINIIDLNTIPGEITKEISETGAL